MAKKTSSLQDVQWLDSVLLTKISIHSKAGEKHTQQEHIGLIGTTAETQPR